MKDIEEQARAILLRARGRAEELIKEGQAQGEIIRTRAALEGMAQGKKAGFEQGSAEGRKSGHESALAEHRAKLTDLVNALSGAAAELSASRNRLEIEAESEVLKLAVAIARRVTHRQASADASVVGDSLANAMKLVVHASDVRIAIHPSSRVTLEDSLPRLKLQWPSLDHVELIEDATISPGGCRIFTRAGEVDANLDGQIDRIAAELVPCLAASPDNPGEGSGEGSLPKPGDARIAEEPSPSP